MSGIKTVTLGSLYEIKMGKTPPRDDDRYWDKEKNTNNLWVSIADISKNEGKYIYSTKEQISDLATQDIRLVPKGSLLFSFKLTLGKMAFAGEQLYTNEAIIHLEPKDNTNLSYLYYYFSFLDWSKIASGQDKVKGKTLNKKILETVPVLYPPLPEQERIVKKLDAAFEKIDQLKKNAENGLQAVKDLWQSALREELKPKEGWVKSLIKDIAIVRVGPFGSTLHKKDYVQGGCPIINPKHMINGQIVIDSENTVSEEKEKELSSYSLQENDIIFARRGEIGRCAIVGKTQKGYLCGTGSLFVRLKNSKNSAFLLKYFVSESFKDELLKRASGATMLNISSNIIENMDVYCPSLDIQQSIVSKLDHISSICQSLQTNYEQELAEYETLKQSILRKAFSGNL